MFCKINKNTGFTLVELMVVITIIGLLASTVLASLTTARVKARDTARIQAVKELQKALELYRNANGGNYPCQTVMPGCIGGGGQVNANGTASTSVFNTALRPFIALSVEATTFASNPTWGSVIYRTGGVTLTPVLNSYTIMVRREQDVRLSTGTILPAESFCGVRVGPQPNTFNWDTALYPNCF